MRLRRLLLVATAASAILPAAASGQATTVSCGQTITGDTVLANDLTNCPGDGLRIRANGITIDLNGHTIDGDGPVPGEGDGDVGIANGYTPNSLDQEAFDGVTVKNGTVRQFESGVSYFTPGPTIDGGLITGLTVEGGGIGLFFGDGVRIVQNVLQGGASIGLDMSSRSQVTDNRVAGGAISVAQSLRTISAITGNLVARNTVADAPDIGISFPSVYSDAEPSGNRFVGNTVRDSGGDGINIGWNTFALVDRNLVTGSGGDGIDVGHEPGFEGFGSGLVVDNAANSNDALGMNVDEGADDGGGNRAADNGDARQCVGVVCRPHGFLFGGGNPGQSFSAMTADAKRATRWFLYYPATVKQLRVYVDGLGGSTGKQVIRGILYREASGAPGQSLVHSFQATIAAGAAPGWVTLPLPYRVELGPGYYWLGIHSGADSGVARFGWNPRPNSRRFNIDAYLDGPASPFGAAPLDDKAIAIHAIGYVRPSG